ncbi:hypothetical protein D6C90_10245 [Aureobasidium pullulans]|nr:hypothetical protein D6C90_10245 [Aureobasidium pullulans]
MQAVNPGSSNPPYTTEEKEFLKREYGGEFNFLMTLGLKIHSEDDRDEGRHYLRTLRADSEDEGRVSSNKRPRPEDSDDDVSCYRAIRMELAPATYFSEDKFSPDQLDFIKKHYGHSGHFIRCHDLDACSDSNYDAAIKVVNTLMTHEQWRGLV